MAALECATPETTAKELVAEVAAQETSLRAIENEMGAQGPVDEVCRENSTAVCMCVYVVTTYSRVWINRVRLPVLLVVS